MKAYDLCPETILSASNDAYKYVCSKSCRLWHMCQDRKLYKDCIDKIY